MAGVRGPELQARPLECLECPSLPRAEFPPLGPPVETAAPVRMAAGRMAGTPRTARYDKCFLIASMQRELHLVRPRPPQR